MFSRIDKIWCCYDHERHLFAVSFKDSMYIKLRVQVKAVNGKICIFRTVPQAWTYLIKWCGLIMNSRGVFCKSWIFWKETLIVTSFDVHFFLNGNKRHKNTVKQYKYISRNHLITARLVLARGTTSFFLCMCVIYHLLPLYCTKKVRLNYNLYCLLLCYDGDFLWSMFSSHCIVLC